MKIACISLGCPKNQVDLDVMVHILLSAGHETVADLAEADVILVNTCGFIESAKTEAIENILEACAYKQQNPNLKVIVTGCLAERYRTLLAVLVFRNKCGNFFSVVFKSDTVAKKLGFLVLIMIIRDFARSVVIVTA